MAAEKKPGYQCHRDDGPGKRIPEIATHLPFWWQLQLQYKLRTAELLDSRTRTPVASPGSQDQVTTRCLLDLR